MIVLNFRLEIANKIPDSLRILVMQTFQKQSLKAKDFSQFVEKVLYLNLCQKVGCGKSKNRFVKFYFENGCFF